MAIRLSDEGTVEDTATNDKCAAGAGVFLDTMSLLKAGKVQVLLGQKYFGWGSEPIRILVDLVRNGKKPATTIIYSGVDVVTIDNVYDYVIAWKKMDEGK